MIDAAMGNILLRLDALERRNRRLRWCVAGVALLAAAAVGVAAAQEWRVRDRVQARRIEILDDAGRARVVLSAGDLPGVRLLGEEGEAMGDFDTKQEFVGLTLRGRWSDGGKAFMGASPGRIFVSRQSQDADPDESGMDMGISLAPDLFLSWSPTANSSLSNGTFSSRGGWGSTTLGHLGSKPVLRLQGSTGEIMGSVPDRDSKWPVWIQVKDRDGRSLLRVPE